ncbi:MAG: alpha/beta hydrolase-fold protein [Actinobacteria bacterium]|nr:alpha/beta hydrolase-fold protein [Actinomycetota bacterium]
MPVIRRFAPVTFGALTSLAIVGITLISTPSAPALSVDLGKMTHIRVASPETDYPVRDVYVWTPALKGVDPNTLPVVYMLHGWSGAPSGIISAVQKPLALAFSQGAKPFIAVFPDGNAKTHPDSEWADSSDKKAMVETWLITKVIPAVEGTNIRSTSNRAILGFSMGGYGATIIALHHPNLFGQVISISGYFVTDDVTGAFTSAAKIASQTPANFIGTAPKFRWYLAEGKDDTTVLIHGQAQLWSKKVSDQMAPVAKWVKWTPVKPTPSSTINSTPTPTDTPTDASLDTPIPLPPI